MTEPDEQSSARDQSASERDQTSSDRDQTSSDADQTSSDRDQTSSDSDQRSSDDDQSAADADVLNRSDRSIYERTTKAREVASDDREATAERRDRSGTSREAAGSDRDRAAAVRDLGAGERDADAHLRDQESEAGASWQDILLRANYDRERAAVDRQRAADDRAQAAADRQVAGRERAEALRFRTESAALLEQAATDPLTGALTRFVGLEDASRELERTRRRPGSALTVAFVDVDGLKVINDSKGHAAGDALLRTVVETLQSHMRRYDVIVRYGGDEFVCVMPDLSETDARTRFETIRDVLAAREADHSISFGLAESTPTERISDVIARADADLLAGRAHGRREPPGGRS
jgi:diguanylate cyclase (GGDEF)-like protein